MLLFLDTFRQVGLSFGFLIGLIVTSLYGWKTGLYFGAIGGFTFGLIAALTVFFQTLEYIRNRPLASDEILICEGQAKYIESGGWMYLTHKRLFFVSHKISIKMNELDFPLAEIDFVEEGRKNIVFSREMIVRLKTGKREGFDVEHPREWIYQIERVKKFID